MVLLSTFCVWKLSYLSHLETYIVFVFRSSELPSRVTEEIDHDTDTFLLLLGRWFDPHRNSSDFSWQSPSPDMCVQGRYTSRRYAVTSTLCRSLCSRIEKPAPSFTRQTGRLETRTHLCCPTWRRLTLGCSHKTSYNPWWTCALKLIKTDSVTFENRIWLQSVTMIM